MAFREKLFLRVFLAVFSILLHLFYLATRYHKIYSLDKVFELVANNWSD